MLNNGRLQGHVFTDPIKATKWVYLGNIWDGTWNGAHQEYRWEYFEFFLEVISVEHNGE